MKNLNAVSPFGDDPLLSSPIDDRGPDPKCAKCGSTNLEYGSVPSMAGFGEDWWLKCLDCGHTETGHPDVS